MGDTYTELLVKRTMTAADKILKAAMIGGTILAAAAGIFLSPYLFVLLGGLIVLDYFLLPSFDLEYEYLYINGELDIDKIMSRSKRKRAASYSMEQVEMIAPFQSHELDSYRQDKNIKVRDFSSREEKASVYAMIANKDNQREMVLFEPNEVILDDMRRIAPRKIKLY